MKTHYKPHLSNLVRHQTSLGRDLDSGVALDRNERVTSYPAEILNDIFNQIDPWCINASPDPGRLYRKIAEKLKMPQENIYVTAGITEGVRVLFQALTNPGENVVVLDPTYPMYRIYAEMYQVEYRKFVYSEGLKPDWGALHNSIDDLTTMVMIPNPNLPIESVFSVEDIRHLADICLERNAVLVIDEAYHHFGAPTVIDLIDKYDYLVVMRSFSKAYGLAGLRLGFMLSTAENIQYLSKTRSLVESNTLSMAIAEYMLDHPEIRDEHVEEVKQGSEYLQQELVKLGLRSHGGNTTNGMLIFLEDENEAQDLVAHLMERKIYIRGSFEPPYHNCVRVSIGPKKIMKVLIDALIDWLNRLKNEEAQK